MLSNVLKLINQPDWFFVKRYDAGNALRASATLTPCQAMSEIGLLRLSVAVVGKF